MSHLSSVDVFHYKAQPVLRLERVLQRLQHNMYISVFISAVLGRLFHYFWRTEAIICFFACHLKKSLWTEVGGRGFIFHSKTEFAMFHAIHTLILTVRNGCRVFFNTLLSVSVWATSSCGGEERRRGRVINRETKGARLHTISRFCQEVEGVIGRDACEH